MSDTLIKVEGLHKKFCQSLKRSLLYGTVDATKSMFGYAIENVGLRKKEFWALQDINFELKRGETLGLIGQNGSGKTTLLRLLNGIFPPDKGKITIKGRIGALIAVGAGFHPHMTGRENIFLNGTILGMTKDELKQKFDEIVDFADLGCFIDSPVATYSSGMTVRLGFAIAIHCEPDILLIDEILAVGDAKFQRKCLDKMRALRKTGIAILIVSHNLQIIESMCEKGILLDKGNQILFDNINKVIPNFELLMQYGESNIENIPFSDTHPNELNRTWAAKNYGGEEVQIQRFKLFNHKKEQVLELDTPNSFALELDIDSKIDDDEVNLNLRFCIILDKTKYLKDEKYFFCTLSVVKNVKITKGQSHIRINFNENILTTGLYAIEVRLYDFSYTLPYAHGEYGYFIVNHNLPNMLNTGKSTPFCWANGGVNIQQYY
jgi:ABC-type polysaccharide/polyol phosphate transport system ATPase subunit